MDEKKKDRTIKIMKGMHTDKDGEEREEVEVEVEMKVEVEVKVNR